MVVEGGRLLPFRMITLLYRCYGGRTRIGGRRAERRPFSCEVERVDEVKDGGAGCALARGSRVDVELLQRTLTDCQVSQSGIWRIKGRKRAKKNER